MAEGPASKAAAKAVATPPAHRMYDDFNLPLVIHMEAPEVPPEIQKLSFPIQQPSKLL
jgi:hypothetical protein